jgi:hypothetical protein
MRSVPKKSRKLLAASIGVATVSYVVTGAACGSSSNGTGPNPVADSSVLGDVNLRETEPVDDAFMLVGNLVAFPVDASDAAAAADGGVETPDSQSDAVGGGSQDAPQDVVEDIIEEFHHIVGNLIAPPSGT